MKTQTLEHLRFLFTPDGFMPDITGELDEAVRKEAFDWLGDGAHEKLYALGAGARPEKMTASVTFVMP